MLQVCHTNTCSATPPSRRQDPNTTTDNTVIVIWIDGLIYTEYGVDKQEGCLARGNDQSCRHNQWNTPGIAPRDESEYCKTIPQRIVCGDINTPCPQI